MSIRYTFPDSESAKAAVNEIGRRLISGSNGYGVRQTGYSANQVDILDDCSDKEAAGEICRAYGGKPSGS